MSHRKTLFSPWRILRLFHNPHLLEQRFWTMLAASFAGREVRILKQLLCFKRVNRAHRVREELVS
jgi:hypothetical protein